MQNIGTDDERAASPDYHHHSDTQVVGSVKAANGTDLQKDPKLGVAVLARGLEEERYAASGSSSLVRSVSARIRYVSQELKLLTAYPKKPPPRIDEKNITNLAVHALEGLQFESETDGRHRWFVVEKRFDAITASTNGVLPRDLFFECIGMTRDSKEFAMELFDALSRRNGIQGDSISKVQLKEFWDQISNQSFDTKLQTIIYMVDKDGDGRISEEEVKEGRFIVGHRLSDRSYVS